MATGGSAPPGSEEERIDYLTCSVCLQIFTSPKRLPCGHTFCLKCIQDVASSHNTVSFPCPQCRRDVTVPSGGVAAFPDNIYLLHGDLSKAQNESMCPIHPKYEVDMYCSDCQQPMCLKCIITKHKQHDTKELSEAANETRHQLKENRGRVEDAVTYMAEEVAAVRTDQQSAEDKTKAVVEATERKFRSLMSVASKCRDDVLASLKSASAEIDSHVTNDLKSRESNLNQLSHLLQQLQEAVSRESDCETVAVAKEMREGWGSVQRVSQLKSPKRNSICRPVVSCKVTEDVVTPFVRLFFGSVEKVEMEVTQPEVKVVEQFRCGTEDDTEVFSLCPVGDGREVWLSFALRGMRKDACSEKFDEKGKHITKGIRKGKVSYKDRENGNVISGECIITLRTFDKSKKTTIFSLKNRFSGDGDIDITTVLSEDPFKCKHTTLFKINVRRHRAFAVNKSETFFIVVEEEKEEDVSPGVQRKVRLYRRDQRDAVDTYRPPSAAYQTCDVCFWQQPDGREILVVADEGTDSLHVLDVQGGAFRFEGYLAAGNPLIVQPTALNTDTRGRLWVALRGGQILTVSYATD